MHRIDHPTKSVDENGVGKDGFTEGTPGTVAATRVTDDWLNHVQEEVAGVVELTDDLDKTNLAQLPATLRKLADIPRIMTWHPREADGGYTETFYAVATRSNITYNDNSTNVVLLGESAEIQIAKRPDTFTSVTGGLPFAQAFLCGLWVEYLSLWIIGGNGGEIQTAPLAATSWTRRTAGSGYSLAFYEIATNETNRVVIVGAVGEIQSSSDGITWTRRNTGGAAMRGVLWDDSQFVAIDDDGVIWTSSDGDTWSSGTDITGSSFNEIYYDNDRELYFASNNSNIYRSSNLTTWVAETAPSGIDQITKLDYSLVALDTVNRNLFMRDDANNAWLHLLSVGNEGVFLKALVTHKGEGYPIIVGEDATIETGISFRNPF